MVHEADSAVEADRVVVGFGVDISAGVRLLNLSDETLAKSSSAPLGGGGDVLDRERRGLLVIRHETDDQAAVHSADGCKPRQMLLDDASELRVIYFDGEPQQGAKLGGLKIRLGQLAKVHAS